MVVDQHLTIEPASIGGLARVGLDRGPEHVVRVMEGLLAALATTGDEAVFWPVPDGVDGHAGPATDRRGMPVRPPS